MQKFSQFYFYHPSVQYFGDYLQSKNRYHNRNARNLEYGRAEKRTIWVSQDLGLVDAAED